MLAVNRFAHGRIPVQTQIPQNEGTADGSMTQGGGLAAAFDGNTDQAVTAGARLPTQPSGNCGKTWSAAKTITGFKIWGANNGGYDANANAAISIRLKGSNDGIPGSAPATLYTLSFTDTGGTDAREVLTGIDVSVAYTTHYLEITRDDAGNIDACLAEVQFFEDV